MKRLIGCVAIALMSAQSHAGVMPSQSRIIYHQQESEKTMMLANTNAYPVIVQTWIDKGEGSPDTRDIPFVSIPPITQLAAGDMKGVRVIYNQEKLPQDRESLFWFNIYEVPPEKKGVLPENSVLVTMNTQIKLFYRPGGINVTPEKAVSQVICRKMDNERITCSNPSPIHLSVIAVTLETQSGQKSAAEKGDFILAPFSEKTYRFARFTGQPKTIMVNYVDDTGQKVQVPVTSIQ